MADVTVYSKQNCMQCNFTKRFLNEHNIPFQTKDVEEDQEALQEVKELGFSSLPVILAKGQKAFHGFHPDKLKQLK